MKIMKNFLIINPGLRDLDLDGNDSVSRTTVVSAIIVDIFFLRESFMKYVHK